MKRFTASFSHLAIVVIIGVAIVVGGTAGYLSFSPLNNMNRGTSSISLASTTETVTAGGSVTDSYSLSLLSGSKSSTNVVVTNTSALSIAGITITNSAGMSDPPYSGTITISVLSSTKAGTYYIPIVAVGGNPSSENVILTLIVTASSSSSSSSSSMSSHSCYYNC